MRCSILRRLTAVAVLLSNMLYLGVSNGAEVECAPPPSGLVGWWRADGSLLDQVQTNIAAVAANLTYTTGRVGQAFVCNGVSTSIRVPHSAASDLGQAAGFTIETWVNPTDLSADGPIAEWGPRNAISGGMHFWTGYPYAGCLYANIVDTSGNLHGINTDGGIVQDQFQHVAVTYDKESGVARLFINGLVMKEMDLGKFTPETREDLYIGFRPGSVTAGAKTYFGVIDELSIYNRALGTNEVADIYSAGQLGKCNTGIWPVLVQQPSNQAVFPGASAEFSATAVGTAPLQYQWKFNNENISGATGSTLVLTNVISTNRGDYSVVVSNSIGYAISSNALLYVSGECQPNFPGIVSWWRGNGSPADSFGTNHGILRNGASFASGKVGLALDFNGVNQFVEISDSPNLNPQGSFSIEGWVLPRQDASQYIFSKWGYLGDQSNQRSYALQLLQGGALRFAIANAANQENLALQEFDTPPGVLAMNAWNHIAAIYDQPTGTRQIFVNGQKVAERSGPSIVITPTTAKAAIGAVLASSSEAAGFFNGEIDECTLYLRALQPNDVFKAYAAGATGKCEGAVAPFIAKGPGSTTAYAGENVQFGVEAIGSSPLVFRWRRDEIELSGETNSTLVLQNVQQTNAGSYTVIVSNSAGAVTSSEAILLVEEVPSCITPPNGLISWWRAESNALDQVGGNLGVLSGNTRYNQGRVGQSFAFDGEGDRVELPNAMSLHLQNFTIEAWIRRASLEVTSKNFQDAELLSFGSGGYGFGIWGDGRLFLTKIDWGNVNSSSAIADTNYHHVAVTKTNSLVVFYIDGMSNSTAIYNPGFTFTTPVAIGGRGDQSWNSFLGDIDELSVYGRALAPGEVKSIHDAAVSGKCLVSLAPALVTQPVSQSAPAGVNAVFSVIASGTAPLVYQWRHGSTNIDGATNASLILQNVQLAQAGPYSVAVSNDFGGVISSNAILTVIPGPVPVRLLSAGNFGGSKVEVPITVEANGIESSMGFSIAYSPTYLKFARVVAGSGASNAVVTANTNMVGTGRLGVALTLPFGTTLAAGTQEVARVIFDLPVITSGTFATVSFSDQPISRQLLDASGELLQATYFNGSVQLTPTDYEGDVLPRPAGNRSVLLNDWMQSGQYAARLAYPTNAAEFQRADCAPRSTLGDGIVSIADWVQTGRYAIGLDPLTAVGGPNELKAIANALFHDEHGGSNNLEAREVRVSQALLFQGQVGTVPVTLNAQGDENALGFSVSFDPALIDFASAALGANAAGAILNINTNELAQGKLGIALALPSNSQFVTGIREVVKLQFRAAASADGPQAVVFGDQPIAREVVSPLADVLPASYSTGLISVSPLPEIEATMNEQVLTLSWPAWAAGFDLQRSTNGTSGWTTIGGGTVQTNESGFSAAVPIQGSTEFFRLRQQ